MNREDAPQKSISFSPEALSAVLFYRAEPVSLSRLASLFSVSNEVIESSVPDIQTHLHKVGLSLIFHNNELQIVTHPEYHAVIETMKKEELTKDLSKASLETLAIILYKGEVTRPDIDFIRGVNSSFIVRNLLVRGLIVRKDNASDSRSFLYTASHDLLSYLGVSSLKELPDFDHINLLLQDRMRALDEEENDAS